MAEHRRRAPGDGSSSSQLLFAALESAGSADSFVRELVAFLDRLAVREPTHPVLVGLLDDMGRRAARAEAAGWLHDIANALQIADAQLYLMHEALWGSWPASPFAGADLMVRLTGALATAREATDAASRITRCTTPYYAGDHGPADVAEVLDASVGICRHLLPKGVDLILESTVDATVAPSRIDLMRVLTNLIRNAIDAVTGQLGGIVAVSAWRTDENVFIRVADNGPGVEPDHLEHLFELYFTTKPEGSGVGLHVCKHLVEAWGGVIQVDSTGPEGTRFTFAVPIGEAG